VEFDVSHTLLSLICDHCASAMMVAFAVCSNAPASDPTGTPLIVCIAVGILDLARVTRRGK
jgi:hypothetical protein